MIASLWPVKLGVVPVDPANVKFKGRLEPGRMFLVDFEKGELISDADLKSEFASSRPYAEWMKRQSLILKDLHSEGIGRGPRCRYARTAHAGIRLYD